MIRQMAPAGFTLPENKTNPGGGHHTLILLVESDPKSD